MIPFAELFKEKYNYKQLNISLFVCALNHNTLQLSHKLLN